MQPLHSSKAHRINSRVPTLKATRYSLSGKQLKRTRATTKTKETLRPAFRRASGALLNSQLLKAHGCTGTISRRFRPSNCGFRRLPAGEDGYLRMAAAGPVAAARTGAAEGGAGRGAELPGRTGGPHAASGTESEKCGESFGGGAGFPCGNKCDTVETRFSGSRLYGFRIIRIADHELLGKLKN